MANIIRIIYGVDASSQVSCDNVVKVFSNLDSSLCSEFQFVYYCVTDIKAVSRSFLLKQVVEFNASYIIFNSKYSYSSPPIDSNSWPMYIYQPILFENAKTIDHSPTLLPINRVQQNMLGFIAQANLLSFAIDVGFIEELFGKIYDKKNDKFDILHFLLNSDMGLWSNIQSDANREICMIPIDLGYDTSMLSTTNLARKDRCPLKIKSFVDNTFQNLSIPIYLQIPSIRLVLTSEQTNIYTTPFHPDLLYIRISSSNSNDSLSEISLHLNVFGINPLSFQLLSELISCLQAKY